MEKKELARVKSYVKKNTDRVEKWKRLVLYATAAERLRKKYISTIGKSYELHNLYVSDLIERKNQYGIFIKIFDEYLGYLTTKRTVRKLQTSFGRYPEYEDIAIYPNEDWYNKEVKGIGVKPEYDIPKRTYLDYKDYYTPIYGLTLENLVYIEEHFEDYDFNYRSRSSYNTYYGRNLNSRTLGRTLERDFRSTIVIEKSLIKDCKYQSFLMSIKEIYRRRYGELHGVVYGENLEYIKQYFTSTPETAETSSNFRCFLEEIIPVTSMDTPLSLDCEVLDNKINEFERLVELQSNILSDLKVLRDTIKTNGDDNVDLLEKYNQKIIEGLYNRIPLIMNDKRYKYLVKLAAETDYRKER